MPLRKLSGLLGYTFKNEALLEQALTHRSADKRHNERLEFLGDAVLNFVVADRLYHRYETAQEGFLTRVRSHLVNQPTLSDIAKVLDVGSFMQLGMSEKRSGGMQRASIQADMLEAILAAVYLDGGLVAAQACVDRWMEERWTDALESAKEKDPKTQLQERMQSLQHPLPEYTVLKVAGPPHQQQFWVSCTVVGLEPPIEGRGTSRRMAEQDAAMKALEILKNVK